MRKKTFNRFFSEEDKNEIIYLHVFNDKSIAYIQEKFKASYREIQLVVSNRISLLKNKDFKRKIENRRFLSRIQKIEMQIEDYLNYLTSEEGQLEIRPKQYHKISKEITRLQKIINKLKAKSLV